MAVDKTRKVRITQKKAKAFKPKRPHKSSDSTPHTTQKPLKKRRENLTLFDWLLVLDFVNSHPDWDQQAIVDHFANRKEGVLNFTQSALSKKLKP